MVCVVCKLRRNTTSLSKLGVNPRQYSDLLNLSISHVYSINVIDYTK